MRRTIGDQEYWVAVLSHERPNSVSTMKTLFGDATWYVNDHTQEQKYLKAKAPFTRIIPESSYPFATAFNTILDDAFGIGLPVIISPDDLHGKTFGTFHFTGRGNAGPGRHRQTNLRMPITMEQAVVKMHERRDIYPFPFHGILPHSDMTGFYAPVRISKFSSGDFNVIWPTHLRYDPTVPAIADVDYILQHIQEYGGVVNHRDIIASYVQAGKKDHSGGNEYYTQDAIDKMNKTEERLKEKWGDLIKRVHTKGRDSMWTFQTSFSKLVPEENLDKYERKIDFYGTKTELTTLTRLLSMVRNETYPESETDVLLRLLVTHPGVRIG